MKLRALYMALASSVVLPAFAHHSFAAYDAGTTLTLVGTIESFQWSNPHVTMKMLRQPDRGAAPQEWSFITSSPNILQGFGWARGSVKPGDRVSIVCNPLRDGTNGGRLHTLVMLATGEIYKTKLSDTSAADLN